MSSVTVILIALAFAGMGLVALLQPARVLTYFAMPAPTTDFRNEIRAVYGGFGLAVAALLVATQLPAAARFSDGVLLAVAVALLGMAAGRVLSWLGEGTGRWPVVFGAVELVGGAALLAAMA